MINDDKRVLEHFYNILNNTKENEKVEVYRQNIKYLVNKLEKHFTQTEQLQELTDEIYQHLEDKESLEQQNKRYREALEEISQKRMAYADMAGVLRIARKALEDGNSD